MNYEYGVSEASQLLIELNLPKVKEKEKEKETRVGYSVTSLL